MYPIEKYRFFQATTIDGRPKVIAVSTFAGKTVRGSAICDVNDEFDLEKGKQIAAARCAEKVAAKRVDRARRKLLEAEDTLDAANKHYSDMLNYFDDSYEQMKEARNHVNTLV